MNDMKNRSTGEGLNSLLLSLTLMIALFASCFVLFGAEDSDGYASFLDDDEVIEYVHEDSYPDGWVAARNVRDGVSNLVVPSTVTHDGVTYEVKIVDFAGKQDLVSVVLSDGIEKIGESNGFYDCRNLKSVTIPDTVTTIGYDAFSYCDSLYRLYLPDSVTTIGPGAFGYSGLTSIRLPESEDFTELPERLFDCCSYLTSVTIPSNVTSIGEGCFNGCHRLQQVVIPENVKHIGRYAFDNCRALTFIDLRCDETTVFEEGSLNGSSVLSGSMVKIKTSLPRELLYNSQVWAIRGNALTGPDLEFGYHLHGNTQNWELSNHEWDLVNGYLKVWAVSSDNTVLPEGGGLFFVADSEGYYGDVRDLIMYVEFVDDPSNGKYLLTSTGTDSFYGTPYPYYVLPEGMTQFDWDSVENPFMVKVPDTAELADDIWQSGSTIIVSDSHVTESLSLDAPSVVMTVGTSLKSNGLLKNFSEHNYDVQALFLSGSTAMISKINSAGLNGGDIDVEYLSDTNGKVYRYDWDKEKWVQVPGLRTVEFDLNDGSGLLTRKIVTDTVGEAGVSFVPGKVFAGWFTSRSGGNFVTPDTSISTITSTDSYLATLYAHWNGALVELGSGVTLTVNGVGYTGLATVPFNAAATVSFDEGHALYYAPGFIVSGNTLTPIANGQTYAVMAKPVGSTYVTLDLAGGEGEFTSYRAYVGSVMDSDFQAPSRVGYTFDGYTNAAGKLVITKAGIYARSVSGYTDASRLWVNENSSVTLTAKWVAHTTQVTFHNMGVVDDVTRTATYGQDFPFVASPTSPDARFDGYYDAVTADGKAAGNLVIQRGHNSAESGSQYFSDIYTWAGDIATYDLYAKWVPKYTLVNDADGRAYDMSGDEPNFLYNPTRTGYNFSGWLLTGDVDYSTAVYGITTDSMSSIIEGTPFSVDGTGLNVASLSSTVGGTVHMVPQWTAIKYKVGFDLAGGTGSSADKNMTFDAKYSIAEPTRAGYIFLGWTLSGDAIGYAECSDTKNGTYVSMSSTTPMKNSSAGSALFVRNLSTDASKKTTMVANWTPGTYTIRYDPNSAEATGYMDLQTVYVGTTVNLVLNGYSRIGHSFIGWSTTPTGSVEYTNTQSVTDIAEMDKTITLYAVWQVNQYTIHFASTGASVIPDITQDYGTPITAPANPVLPRYEFSGWDPQLPAAMPAHDMTVTAQWVVGTYAVTFKANGGSGAMDVQSITYGQSTALSSNVFSKTGYTFSSWNTKADGTGTGYANKEAVLDLDDITLYAQWTPIKYTVRFHINSGSTDSTVNQTMTYDKSASLKANTFVNAPYSFESWNTKANGTGTSYADKATVKNLVKTSGSVFHLYAQWDAPVTAITLAKGEGTSDGSATAKYGGSSAVIVTPATGDLRLAGYYSGNVLVINPDGTYPADASTYVSNGVWVCTDSTLVLTAKWRAPYEIGDVFEDSGIMFRITSVSPDQVEAFDVSEPTDTIRIPGVAGYMGTDFAVVSIAEGGFSGCETAVFVSIPDSVRAIGPGAFYGIVFYEANGTTVLQKTAEALSGYQYMGSDGKLVREGISVGDQFVYQGLKYEVTSVEPYTATVIGYEGTLKNLDVPLYAVHKGINLSVTAIGTQAFYKCKTLVTASLGGVAKVGVKAFAGCTKLTTVDVGEKLSTISAYGFWGCTSLVDIDLRDSAKTMRSIGSYAFYNDAKLSSITIPSYMTLVSDAEGTFSLPFQDADGKPLEVSADTLKGYRYDNVNGVFVRDEGVQIGKEYSDGVLNYKVVATLPYELEVIGYNGTIRALDVPETIVFDDYEFVVSSIGVNAFNGCKTMKTANLGHVDTIKSQAFYGCTGLKTIDMPYVVSIGTKAFARCTSLTDPVFGERLATISAYGFWGCTALKDVDLPDTVTSIGTYAFQRCSSLSSIDLGKSLRLIGTKAFDGTAIESLEIPSSIVRLKEGSLAGCSELRTVSMAGGQKVILHMGLFEGTPGIQTIVMPDSFKKIYAGAFDGVTFHKANGADLPVKAANLAGHVFIGADCDLTLDDYCTVGFGVQPNGSGTVSETSLEVRYGAPMFVVDGVLYVDNTPVYATPAPGYELTGWLYFQAVEDITVYAMFAEI